MALEMIDTRFGHQAMIDLARSVTDAKQGDPLSPVSVIVPSNYVGVATRRWLASGRLGAVCGPRPGLVGVSFHTLYRMAELLGAPLLAAAGRRPVSNPVVAAAVRRVLTDHPGMFAPVRRHPTTESSLVRTHRELRECTDDQLDRLSTASRRASEVVRVHREVERILDGLWYDEVDLMGAAVEALRDRPEAANDLGAVLVHLPLSLTPTGITLIRAVSEHTPVRVLLPISGNPAADLITVETLGPILPSGAAVPPGPPPDLPEGCEVRVIGASDADEETAAAVAALVEHARRGVPAERMALLYSEREPYAALVAEHLEGCGLSYNGPVGPTVAQSVPGRVLHSLIDLALELRDDPDGSEGSLSRQAVLGLLQNGPVRFANRPAPVADWERLTREAGIIGGFDQWQNRLDTLARSQPDLAEDAAGLASFVTRIVATLRGVASATTWTEQTRIFGSALRELLGPTGLRGDWPPTQIRAADTIDALLDQLSSLDSLGVDTDLEVFSRTVSESTATQLRVGGLGEGVLVGPLPVGVGLDLSVVVVVGATEDHLPGRTREDSLLSDRERQLVPGVLRRREDRPAQILRDLLGARASASVERVECYPRGDLRRTSERLPSRWLAELVPHDGRLWPTDLLEIRARWHQVEPSFEGTLAATAFPTTEQRYRLHSLLRAQRGGRRVWDHPMFRLDSRLHRSAQLVQARASDAFTRFDGNLSGLELPSPLDGVVSATGLESWVGCPYAYFANRILRVRPVTDPEELLEMSPLDRGSLIHKALEELVVEALGDGGVPLPDPGEPWTEPHVQRIRAIAEDLCDHYEALGLTGHPTLWRRQRRGVLASVEHMIRHDNRHRATANSHPLAAELSFGRDDPPLDVALPDGRVALFHGSADRVDRSPDGSLTVIDYKTGKPNRYRGLSQEDPTDGGRLLQLPLYALAARRNLNEQHAPVHAHYLFDRSHNDRSTFGFEVDDRVLSVLGESISTIVQGIEAGIFPAHPEKPSFTPFVSCHYCDPDGLGTAPGFRRWERKMHDPALATYVALVDPASTDPAVAEDQA